ncbi:Ig-like domain-containing protein [Bradyrhizobium sp. LVM 105]|uniref:Ig-like domain-containing protein n=1 Tax=Bradyrhizobium sp. LVM 105 TaxID=2341115 RepID=UPI0013DE956A|nr:Ig-like domain-containing protein [Bradyrhizobium sp. LVM 105]
MDIKSGEQVMAVNDGSANAPVGSAQLSSLLDTYGANRPAWNVAGVDYHVGVPTGLTLKDPATISMAGVSVDAAQKSITVTGSNVTLDGYDFGGWAVVTTAANTTLTNSNFNGLNPSGPQDAVITGTSSSSNLHITNCTIDGLSGGGHAEFLVEMEGPGLTIEYSWLKNSNSDLIGRHGQDGGDITIQYNLLQQAGMGGAGTHGDYLQVYGPTIDSTHILYNTAVQDGGTTQGFIADNTKSGEFAGNTLIGSVSYWMSVSGPGTDAANLSGAFSTHDNYFDVTKAFGFNYPAAGPDDSYSQTSFVHNVNMVTGEVEQDANAPAYTGPTYTPPTSPAPSAPAAPVVASFSTDSGVSGDGVTNDSTLELKGTAAAGSTVKIYDGSTQIGTATATSTGSWDYITQVLTDAKHTLTATATNTSGQTSAASAAVAVTVDTKAPAAPTIASDTVNATNQVVMSGTAEANSAIRVFDGTTQVGTATTNSSGAWSVTTSALSAGSHALTAKATDVAGNVSAASTAVDPVIGTATSGTGTSGTGTSGTGTSGTGTSGTGTSGTGTSGTGTSGTGTTAPAAPKITSFSTDSGVAGDHITSDKTLTLAGTAAANSTVKVFDGTTQLGIATADANGAWHYSTAALLDGKHSLTATDTVSGVTSKASTALDVTVDTTAPDAPVLLSDPTTHNRATVSGTAEAGSSIKLYEGTTLLGTTTVGSDGDWSVTTPNLKHGSHTFTATATDAAGNTSALSQPIDPPIGSHDPKESSSTVEVTNVRPHWDHTATIKGIADPNSEIRLSDGTTSVGSVTAGADGKWSFHTSDLSGRTHAFTAEQVDTTGHVVGTSSGEAIIGSGRRDTLTSTAGNDVMVGKRGADTFEFASNFGHDVIKDFAARGPAHDTIEFSKSVFDSFASVLSHAAQSGRDVVIATGSDTLTLKNTQLDKLNSHDFHFA